jgi:hypothetical protein
MARYITAESLAEAVSRLAASNARPSLCDFLIVKHAMTQGDGTVSLSLADETYMSSVQAFARVLTNPDEVALPPFFNPFGTMREARRGWRTEKYPSNGPPDTVNGPGWKRVIDVLSEGPRRVRLTSDYLDHLPKVISKAGGPRPSIEDSALWYYRSKDIKSVVGRVEAPLYDLVQGFVTETGLSSAERAAIFGER